MFAQQGGRGVQGRQGGVVVDGDVGGVIDAFQPHAAVKPLRKAQKGQVGLGRGSDDHLGALTGRGEGRSPFRRTAFRGSLLDSSADVLHGGKDGSGALLGRPKPQAALRGKLDVDAHAVGQAPQDIDQLVGGPGDDLGVDVAAEAELAPQQRDRSDEIEHGVVGAAPHRGTEEEPLDVVAPVEGGRDLRDLPRREGGARHVVAAAVDAVGAVVNAVVGEQQLQQGDAAPVVGPRVADARRAGMAQPAPSSAAVRPAGCAGDVVFRSLRQDAQSALQVMPHRGPLRRADMLSTIFVAT